MVLEGDQVMVDECALEIVQKAGRQDRLIKNKR